MMWGYSCVRCEHARINRSFVLLLFEIFWTMSSEMFDSSCNPGISQNPSNPSFILGTLKLKSQSNPTSTSVNTDAPNYMISVKKKTVFSRHVIRCLLHRCPRCKDVQTVRRPHAFTCPVGSAASPPRRRTPRSERPGRTSSVVDRVCLPMS